MNRGSIARTLLSVVGAGSAGTFLVASAVLAQEDVGVAWPLLLEAKRVNVVIYQPQIESFEGDRLAARAAVSVTPKGEGGRPVFGAVWFDARMATDFDERTVTCEELDVTAAKFPDVSDEKLEQLKTFVERELPTWDLTLSLDLLLASIEGTPAGRDESQFSTDPPEIIFVEQPAVLVMVDGDPILEDVEGFALRYVVNTPYFIVQEQSGGPYYLRGAGSWYVAPEFMAPWSNAATLPAEVQKVSQRIAESERKQAEEEAKLAAASGQPAEAPTEAAPAADGAPPLIFVRTRPAELIFTDGEPDFVPVEGTQLLYVSNTESDVVVDIATQQYYTLVAGRWYTSKQLESGWAFVEPDALPPDFARIPEDSDLGNVLASVAGTRQAQEALLENTIPQTAAVERKTATVEVTYDGDPEFEKCTDSGVAYARNTDKAVLRIDGKYYCCHDAVWFVSSRPTGPWSVCDEVPAVVQDIPPDCPVYNVKYVYIYETTPEVVYVGYTPGYVGSYPYGGVVVYGTGFWYHPWYRHYYYPRPVTYGFGVHYNPWTGWGFSVGMSVGWLHISVGRPMYGGWWGPAGYAHGYRRGYHHGYHHGYRHGYRHGAARGYAAGYRAGQRQPHANVYNNHAHGVRTASRSAQTRATNRSSAGLPRQATRQARQPEKSKQRNNVYADRKGNVHRKQGESWQQRDNGSGSWKSSGQSQQNVQRDYQNRQRSNQRTRDYNRSRQRPPQARPAPRSGRGRR